MCDTVANVPYCWGTECDCCNMNILVPKSGFILNAQ